MSSKTSKDLAHDFIKSQAVDCGAVNSYKLATGIREAAEDFSRVSGHFARYTINGEPVFLVDEDKMPRQTAEIIKPAALQPTGFPGIKFLKECACAHIPTGPVVATITPAGYVAD